MFAEEDFAPLAELLWFREAASFSDEDRLRTLPESARAYHSFGTTSIFEGHGVASEVLRAYRRRAQGGHADHARDAVHERELDTVRRCAARSVRRGLAGVAR